MRLLIAEDHAIVRAGLTALLNAEPDCEVVGEVDRVTDLRPMVETLQPDLLIADYSMPDGDTFATIEWLTRRDETLGVIVMTGVESPLILQKLIESRIHGLVSKVGAAEELTCALQAYRNGERYISDIAREHAQALSVALTARETQVLAMVVAGRTRSEIARELSVSTETIKTHRRNLMDKLQVHSTAELTRKARELNLIA